MCVCTCTCHTGALHITCTCNRHIVLLLSRYSVKDPGQRSRIEEEFVARSKCIQSHNMYVTLPFTSMLIAAKPYKSTMDPSPHLYPCWWQPNYTRACTDSMHALGPALIGSEWWQLSLTLCMCDCWFTIWHKGACIALCRACVTRKYMYS